MSALMDRSIDLLEERARECNNAFGLNRRGYWFVSASTQGAAQQLQTAEAVSQHARSTVRIFSDGRHGQRYDPGLPYDAQTETIRLFRGEDAVRAFIGGMPEFVTPKATSLMHCGRCGWMSAQQMGAHLLSEARAAGTVTLCPASLVAVHAEEGRVSAVSAAVGVPDGTSSRTIEQIPCHAIINCAGPFAAAVDELLQAAGRAGAGDGLLSELPLLNEVHAKAVLRDERRVVPDEATMCIWQDPIDLGWDEDERVQLREMGGFEARIADVLPAGAHFRPYPGSPSSLIMLWEALHDDLGIASPPPEMPPIRDELFGELTMRALSLMVPRLSEYVREDGTMSASISVDGGYYTKTPDNLPLIGPVPGAPHGAFMCAGLSGYGVMAANAAGHLLAQHVVGEATPSYADAILPERWHNHEYHMRLQQGQVKVGLQI
eukprot:CAMPEP_0119380458 /NCGR_PEP_ID=MMETSP1334-20130426/57046_1 /TAXON_ID=127549 /ORGANISM="Calcidiscus leptoporus, Strain RCC1130" /LENGTH=432 /DNA_ID=CAMNT_0007400291 /DNA_START=205 /DNA_END=1503 /DNA_ORIENTATION=+